MTVQLSHEAVMDDETLTALKGSIEKWEKIVAGTGVDLGAVNCPLCKLFVRGVYPACRGCPVSKAVGVQGCQETPYEDFRMASGAKREAAARAELDFLRSLLPTENVAAA